MSAIKKILLFVLAFFSMALHLSAAEERTLFPCLSPTQTLTEQAVAKELGWVPCDDNYCGGFYAEPPFLHKVGRKKGAITITGNGGLLSQHGTSILGGGVTVSRDGQQMTANKAFLYRNPVTAKLNAVDLIGDVHFREPNTLIIGKKGRYNFDTGTKSLIDLLYRTVLNNRKIVGPDVPELELLETRRVVGLTAWGSAYEFSQTEPRVYELCQASFSTCPPIHPAWQLKAGNIVINKNTGRGYATHARILVRNIPVFYVPYISFSIDRQRKTGFLWPTLGSRDTWGSYFLAPFYWNMAPNYDMMITTGLITKRGLQLSDTFRYLTPASEGKINVSLLPNDIYFADFQRKARTNLVSIKPQTGQPLTVTQAELNRLLNASTTRRSLFWRDDSRFSPHLSTHVDYNYAGDDYYLQDFGSNLNEISKNYLLQEGTLFYRTQYWHFIGRLQSYQTLHPVNENLVINQYRRLPQLVLNADFPDQIFGLDYFFTSEATHFEILKTPGTNYTKPVGTRLHIQPGISLPWYSTCFYITPRLQIALTQYALRQTKDTNAPVSERRYLPIFDVVSGLSLTREINFFGQSYEQTLEPQIYYTYIPYRNQASIPIFDTAVNMLTYDQIFNYNRFSGLDRIGDANQVGIGVTSRLIDRESGIEKARIGLGNIIYFNDRRRVTLCNDSSCSDNPATPSNHWSISPVSGLLNYNVVPHWNFAANVIWNPISKQLDNSTLTLHYQTDNSHILNFGIRYAYSDVLSGVSTTNSINNLKITDVSFVWPLLRDVTMVGRWSHDWNQQHLQNLLFGLQYDTCCWTVRLVGGRTFVGLDPQKNNSPQYNTEGYIEIALKGLGNISSGNPSGLLSSITGYNTQFGQEF